MKITDLTQRISIRWRLTMLFVAVFGTTFVLFSVLIFDFLSTTLEREFDDSLFNYAVDVHESISLNPSGDMSLSSPALDRGKLYPFAHGTALIQIRHVNGEVLTQVGDFGSLNVPFHREIDRLVQGEEAVFRTISKLEGLPNKEAEEYRMVTMPIDNSPQPQLLLQIAVPMSLLDEQLASRRVLLEIAVPLALLIAILGGYFLSTRALRPVSQMISTAEGLGAERLSERIPIPPTQDEVQKLAIALNAMFTRIEKAFASQERFIADASHQLLTPLTIMRGELEATLRNNAPPSRELLSSSLQEVDHLSQIVQQLLLLARVEAGRGALQLSPVSFPDVIIEALARANRSAQKKSIRLHLQIEPKNSAHQGETPPMVNGDFDLLQNLVYNLIENAVKYSPAGESVFVSLFWDQTSQVLKVEDNGPGVPPDQLSLIFERFHRGETRGGGHGLGLAIVKKIADAHRGSISVSNKYLNSHDKNKISGCFFSFEIRNI